MSCTKEERKNGKKGKRSIGTRLLDGYACSRLLENVPTAARNCNWNIHTIF